MASVSYIGTGTFADGYAVTLSPGLPAGWQEGDLLLLFQLAKQTHNATPSGWTTFVATVYGTGEVSCWIKISWKIATSDETAPEFYGGGSSSIGQVIAFRGINPSAPINVFQHWPAIGSASPLTIGGQTTTVDGCKPLWVVAANDNYTYSGWTSQNMTVTEAVDDATAGTGSDSYGISLTIGVGDSIVDPAGSTGTANVTPKKYDRGFNGTVIALTPAPTPTIDSISATSGSLASVDTTAVTIGTVATTAGAIGSTINPDETTSVEIAAQASIDYEMSAGISIQASSRSFIIAEILDEEDIPHLLANSMSQAAVDISQYGLHQTTRTSASIVAATIHEFIDIQATAGSIAGETARDNMATIVAPAQSTGTAWYTELMAIAAGGGGGIADIKTGLRYSPADYLTTDDRIGTASVVKA
ncbi:hypothetical protein RE476_02625 [Methanolobus mangrovi]|uniref:Uncharacterized protein n=1 Tax=Methanolobus mangrovi TaxID=3072977 RepID=A0AA51UGV7_9EURY|nr:hypothetical protein [Methanolobus mangrovi]WMW22733.1 hypothetical protein RE476_02625 [Methanolobus mangrovi]